MERSKQVQLLDRGFSGSIAAVIVTYNRKKLLVECLNALISQTRPPDAIYIVDNASVDGTEDLLHQLGFLDRYIVHYIRLSNNSGGAGGFHEGLKRAFNDHHEWFWIMDDDAEPTEDALRNLEPFLKEDVVAAASLVVDRSGIPEWSHRGWFHVRFADSLVRPIRADDLVNEQLEVNFASFVGLMISHDSIDKIGLPKKEFFIHYDDNEYCVRLKELGAISLVVNSVIIHKDNASIERSGYTRRIFGHVSTRIPIDRLWLSYYGSRNQLWLRLNRFPGFVSYMYMVYWYTRKLTSVMLYDNHKFRRLWFWSNAFSDAISGRFDNEKPRRLLRRLGR